MSDEESVRNLIDVLIEKVQKASTNALIHVANTNNLNIAASKHLIARVNRNVEKQFGAHQLSVINHSLSVDHPDEIYKVVHADDYYSNLIPVVNQSFEDAQMMMLTICAGYFNVKIDTNIAILLDVSHLIATYCGLMYLASGRSVNCELISDNIDIYAQIHKLLDETPQIDTYYEI